MKAITDGCLVRVLIVLEDNREDYRIGMIRGIEEGPIYGGFTHDATVRTKLHLSLDLPGAVRGINGSLFQLNSISNSNLSDAEITEWLQGCGTSAEVLTALLQARADRVRPFLRAPRRNRPPASGTAASTANNATFAGNEITATVRCSPTQLPPQAPQPLQVASDSTEPDVPSEAQIRHQVMEDLRSKHAMFPRICITMKTPHLRIAERDLIEYLDRVRECIASNRSNCVVCLQRIPTVILLPCKHKVLCRLCASQVTCCPCCRETVVEMFEPVET